ncbi:hypothetical protein FH972_002563 [Carpinus fangiana]|uniref:Phytocyanin domain-containing protein n=1 Tax=Carpinus fangiana TaxID=176857 RepID=A0A5N6QH46_9ROSI|nr:hypothetical protein FH972_002563 [Carpinus fangiana]
MFPNLVVSHGPSYYPNQKVPHGPAFNYYPSFHNVAVVDVKGYKGCSPSSKAKIYTSGKDRIKLSKGRNYFICSIPGHCDEGMKLSVYAH